MMLPLSELNKKHLRFLHNHMVFIVANTKTLLCDRDGISHSFGE